MLSPAEADAVNRAAQFLFFPQVDGDTRACIEFAGIQVYSYFDDSGTVCVSVHLDTAEPSVRDTHGVVPLRIVVEATTVFDSVQEAEDSAGRAAA